MPVEVFAVEVFAVEPTAAQLVVHAPEGAVVQVSVGDHRATVHGPIDVVEVAGLAPKRTYVVQVDGRSAATFTTFAPPPGELVGRIATISDLHVGETAVGLLPRLHSHHDPALAHPMVALPAALDAVVQWGAELLVVKGDVAAHNVRAEYELAVPLLRELPIPLVVLPGNHDGGNHRQDNAFEVMASLGLALVRGTEVVDLPGVRIVAADTMWPRHDLGRLGPVEADVLDSLAGAPGPCLLALHHQLVREPVPTYLPVGVPWPWSRRFLGRVARANPDTFVTTGHTHRHRRWHHGPLVVTEVGSIKDYPGTWAGYLVYEGGIVQVVRRVADRRHLAWSQTLRATALGLWGRWAPGRVHDRSFPHPWPSAGADASTRATTATRAR